MLKIKLFIVGFGATLLIVVAGPNTASAAGCLPRVSGFHAAYDFPHVYSDLKPDPAVTWGQLDNGFRYVLMKNRRPEDRVNAHLMVGAGSFHETDTEQGLAHYLEHLLFCGSENFPPGELIKYFQKIGMRFGNDANAHTGFFYTVYDLHLPAGDRKTLQEGLVVIQDYAAGALIPEAEVERERAVILAEKRTRDSVGYRTYKASLNFELAGARVINRYPIGIEPVIKKADRVALKGFYDAWYRPDNMILVVVGDVNKKMVEELINAKFATLAPRAPARPIPDFGQVQHQGTKSFYHYEKEAGNTDVTIETIRQAPRPHDSADRVRERLVRDLAYQIMDYRLDELAAGEDPPFISASASAGRAFREILYASIAATCAPDDWERALSAIDQELRKVLSYGFTMAEVERVQKEILAALDRSVKQVSTRESGSLAGQIRGSLAGDRVFQSPAQRRKLMAPVIKKLTPEKLHQALLASWQEENRLVLVTGNAVIEAAGDSDAKDKKSKSAEEQIVTVYKDSLKEPVSPPAEQELAVFPYLPTPSPGKITQRQVQKDIDVTQVTFENQVRLNYKQTDFKANQVVAKVIFGRGESMEPETAPALCELGAAVVNESGFGQMKKEDLKRALAGKKAGIAFSVADGHYVLTGQCETDEVELLFQLFYTFFKDFGCRPEAYEQSLKRYQQSYETLTHTIDGAMTLSGYRFLAGGDSRFGLPPSYDAFTEITLADIRAWMTAALAQSLPEISVVGDFDEEVLLQAASTCFGQYLLPEAPASTLPDRRGPDFPEGDSRRLTVPTEIKKGRIEVAWPTEDIWDIGRTRRLSVLSEVFTERMRKVIREQGGQSYSQYAYNAPSRAYPDYGVFHAVVEVAPPAADTVVSQVKAIAQHLVEKGLTADELQRAKDPLVTQIKEYVKTNGYWLNSVLSGSTLHPEQLDWCRNFLSDYQSVTLEEVRTLAQTYLDNKNSAAIVVVPEQ